MTQFILIGIVLLLLQLSLYAIAGYFIFFYLKKEFTEIASLHSLNKVPAEIEKIRISVTSLEEEMAVSLNHLKPAITELRKTAEEFKDMQTELKETHSVAKSTSLLLARVANKSAKEVR